MVVVMPVPRVPRKSTQIVSAVTARTHVLQALKFWIDFGRNEPVVVVVVVDVLEIEAIILCVLLIRAYGLGRALRLWRVPPHVLGRWSAGSFPH